MNKARLEAFSDGVIAIIITIMVLEIKVPHGAEWINLKPLLVVVSCYVLSFMFVGIYWVNHHHLLHTVKAVNSGIMWANLHLLFWLSLIPFATDWMGENHFATNPVILYAALLLICGIAFTILQFCIQQQNRHNAAFEEAFQRLRTKGLISVAGYIASIPLAYVNTIASGLIFLLIGIIWLIPEKAIEKALKE